MSPHRLVLSVFVSAVLSVGCDQSPPVKVDPSSARLSLGDRVLLYDDSADSVFAMLSPRGGRGQDEICFPTVGTPATVIDDGNTPDRHGQRDVKLRIESGEFADRVGTVSRKNLRPIQGR